MSSLRQYLIHKRAAFHLLQAKPSEQVEPLTLHAQTTAEHRSGIRRIRIRDFQIISDSPRDFAGYNLGPGSPELQLGVLGSCLTHIFLIQAAAKGVILDALEVEVRSRPDAQPNPEEAAQVRYPRNITYSVHIDSPASDEQLAALHQAVEQVCPIYNLLSLPQQISGEVLHTPSPETPEDGADTGLRDYLLEKRSALLRRREQAKARALDPEAPPAPGLRARVKAEGRSGVRRIRIREFQIISDSPDDFAGYNLGSSSPENQLGVLSSCLTHVFLIQAADRQIPLDALEVKVQGTLDPRAGRPGFEQIPRFPHNIHYSVQLQSPASAEQIEALHLAVKAVCPIYNLLKDPQQISGDIVRHPLQASA